MQVDVQYAETLCHDDWRSARKQNEQEKVSIVHIHNLMCRCHILT